METFSSEIGKKMRSAVKAKLIELGTEGSTGYVDEELPDYVMIMVANKRSKQQMTSDLTLFLGTKTELFVTWLHEVLQKLQEVTVPAPAAKKRKSSQKEETSSKKDKKAAKKDKKILKRTEHATTTEKSATTAENSATTVPVVPILPTGSIRDVFAEDLLEKAKHSLTVDADAAANIKKAKAPANRDGTNEFDIPTISEISSSTSVSNKMIISFNRAKDLAELAEIQKKIYAAKKHLKELGELKDQESEDEDLLKLRDEGSSDGLGGDHVDNTHTVRAEHNANKGKSPIVFDKGREASPDRTPPRTAKLHSPQPLPSAAVKSTTTRNSSTERKANLQHGPNVLQRGRERERRESPPQNKRPVHERLGAKVQNQEKRTVRREKELYVPAHRRQDPRDDRERDRERWRSRERDDRRAEVSDRRTERDDRRSERHDRRNERNHKERPIERETRNNNHKEAAAESDDEIASPQRAVTRHRVISQVIVAPAKPTESSEDEAIDKPVNSIIKVKPRAPVSPSRQACKNLLLRAVAEAQRSTILSKSKSTTSETKSNNSSEVKSRLGRTVNTENEEFFTKDLRERRLKRSASNSVTSSMLFRRQAENFIIEVEGNVQSKRRRDDSEESVQSGDDEPYNPKPVTDRLGTTLSVSYKPHTEEEDNDIADYDSADDIADELALQKTQFVVTLNEEKAAQKLKRLKQLKQSHSHTRSPSPQQQVSSSSSIARHNSNEPTSTTQFDRSRSRETRRSDIRSRLAKNKLRPATPLSPLRAARLRERESANSSPSSTNTPPHQQRRSGGSSSGYVDNYQRKPKDVKKIIIKNDTDDEISESSPQKHTPEKERKRVRDKSYEGDRERDSERERERDLNRERDRRERKRSLTPPILPVKTIKSSSSDRDREKHATSSSVVSTVSATTKSRHIPIKFDLDRAERIRSRSKSREHSLDRRDNGDERRKISIRGEINNKYDNIPSLSSVALDSAVMRVIKPKERCKYHPNCTKQFCDFYHPTAPCKAFPNCKYADKCMYSHPNCKYDMACTNLDCNFSHSGIRNPSQLQPTAPPLSSHVVPVQNYKTISATAGASSAMCKYYPNCSKAGCTFYHPKPCKFGKNCINKLECNFYHHELQSKFKWVASAT